MCYKYRQIEIKGKISGSAMGGTSKRINTKTIDITSLDRSYHHTPQSIRKTDFLRAKQLDSEKKVREEEVKISVNFLVHAKYIGKAARKIS